MIEKIKEKNVWDELKSAGLPVVLYGMGDGADQVIAQAAEFGIEFADVFASDGFVRGQSFHGKRVLKLSEAEEKYGEFIIVTAFAVHDEKMLKYISELSKKHILFSPTVPVAGGGLLTREFIKAHDEEFDRAYSLLADGQSKKAYADVLNFAVSAKPEYLLGCQSEKNEVYESLLCLSENERILDLGAYDGDTIREFLSSTGGKYERITAFEPDEKNFKKLIKKTEGMNNLVCLNIGAWDKKETLFFEKKSSRSSRAAAKGAAVRFEAVDGVISSPVSFIKMDVEGAERNALLGAKETVRKNRPKLYVCAYHRNEDMFALPLLIEEILPGYKFYFRHHPYIPAWESNFYCVYPK